MAGLEGVLVYERDNFGRIVPNKSWKGRHQTVLISSTRLFQDDSTIH